MRQLSVADLFVCKTRRPRPTRFTDVIPVHNLCNGILFYSCSIVKWHQNVLKLISRNRFVELFIILRTNLMNSIMV